MTALWVILGILAFFVLLFALPVRIFLNYTPEGGLRYRVKYAFLTLADSEKSDVPKKQPSAEKAAKEKKPTSGGAVQSFLSFLGLADISSAANAKKAIGEKGLSEVLRGVTEAVASLLRRIGRLLKKGVFKKFDLHIVSGDGDPAEAALHYGTLCAAVYPLITLLDSAMKFKRRTVDIRCDYDSAGTQADFDGQLNYRPWHFLCFACGLLWRYVKQNFKKEG